MHYCVNSIISLNSKMLTSYLSIILISSISCKELTQVVDLTWDFDNETIYWTGVTPFSYTKKVAENRQTFWYSANEFCAGEHGGTHLDAPYHFNAQGWKVADLPLDRLLPKGVLIDLSHNQSNLLPKHLDAWIQKNGEFHANTLLLVKFGRSKLWKNKNAYLGIDQNGNYNFPGVSPEAAKWIAESGKIIGVGLDVASVDPGNSTEFQAHRILSQNQIYVLENVKIVGDLPESNFNLIVLPMKLKEGSGAPVRILALPKNFIWFAM